MSPRTLSGTVASWLLVATLLAVPVVSGLDASQQGIRGQVIKVLPAQIDGHPHGVVLSVDRTVNREPFAELRVVPGPDPDDWIAIRLHDGPTAMAVGDVDGDGDDDVAVAHQLAGETCPFPHIGNGPCGVVRIYDGTALARGDLQTIAQVSTLPIPDTCPPSSFNPAAVALGDVTGDGRAELALAQLGLLEKTCGTVYVLPGDRIVGNATVHDACIKTKGPPGTQGKAPDHFGSHMELFADRYLAIGAPYDNGTDDVPVAGLLAVHDVRDACHQPASSPAATEPVAELRGDQKGQLFGTDTAYAEGTLWAAFKGGIRGFDVPSFEPTHTYDIPRSFPLQVAGDLNGDGRTELQAGPWIVQPADPEEELILHMVRFAEETFRGAVIGPDHILSSDKFGARLWSLTDIWDPFLHIAPEKEWMHAGGTMRVFVAEKVFLLPDPGSVQWEATGATILEQGDGWIRIRAGGPGVATVQATLEDTTVTLQVPVRPAEDSVQVTGAGTALVGHPVVARVYAPNGSAISWHAPGGSPDHGTGPAIKATYALEGQYNISIQVTLPDGAQTDADFPVTVFQGSIRVQGPSRIDQGDRLGLSVPDPKSGHTYSWILEQRTGISALEGTSIQTPIGGWGRINATVIEWTPDGTATAAGHHSVQVDNLPPVIGSMQVLPSQVFLGVEGQAAVADPGGDPVALEWSVQGVRAGSNASFSARISQPGSVSVTLVATDASGLSTTQTRTVEVRDPWEVRAATEPGEDDGSTQHRDEAEQRLDEAEGGDKRGIPFAGTTALAAVAAVATVLRRMRPER